MAPVRQYKLPIEHYLMNISNREMKPNKRTTMDIRIHDIDRCFRSDFVDYLSSPELAAILGVKVFGSIGGRA